MSVYPFSGYSDAHCPNGWVAVTDMLCYMAQTTQRSFDAAQSVCQKDGGKLVSVWSKAEFKSLKSFAVSGTNYIFH